MKSIVFKKGIATLAGMAVLVIGTLLIVFPYSLEEQSYTATPQPSLPLQLSIPSIGVNAPVEYVGVTNTGAMGVPAGPVNVAWYAPGTKPGEVGTAVINGHSGWKDNIPAVFDNLHKVHVGDKIFVTTTTATSTFIVRRMQTFKPTASTTSIFISNDGGSHLNLITCSGEWNPISKSTSERFVVFADKE